MKTTYVLCFLFAACGEPSVYPTVLGPGEGGGSFGPTVGLICGTPTPSDDAVDVTLSNATGEDIELFAIDATCGHSSVGQLNIDQQQTLQLKVDYGYAAYTIDNTLIYSFSIDPGASVWSEVIE